MTCVVERLPTRQVRTHTHTVTQKPATLVRTRVMPFLHSGVLQSKLKRRVCCKIEVSLSRLVSYFLGMTYHKRTEHFEEKPFSCEDCGAKFGANSSLKNHMRLHTGEKPYRCKHCDMSFTVAAALAYHTKKKHSEGNSRVCIFH